MVFGKTPDDWSIGRFSKVQLPREFALLIKFLGAVGVDVVDVVVVVVVVVVVANRIKVPCCFLVGARVVINHGRVVGPRTQMAEMFMA